MAHADLEVGNTIAVSYEKVRARTARIELRAALAWYLEASGIRRAEAFEQVFDAKLTLLAGNPHSGTPGKNNIRALPLLMFPWTIHYRVDSDTIHVLAVAHQRRKPGYWRRR